MSAPADTPVVAAAKREWPRWKGDCSGFVHAVAVDVGIDIKGTANAMVAAMSSRGSGWIALEHDAKLAATYANRGFFVVGGLKAAGHGHVVVIVPTPAGSRYPLAYWGRLGGVGREDTGIDWAWKHRDLPNVSFFAKPVLEAH